MARQGYYRSAAALAATQQPVGGTCRKTAIQWKGRNVLLSAAALTATALFSFDGHAQSQCYDAANVGEIGTEAPCKDMLIVNRTMLDSAKPNTDSSDFTITLDNGDAYTFGNSEKNVFTGQVTNMDSLFSGFSSGKAKFNAAIGYWNVSKVTSMERMFEMAKAFNQPLNDWDVSKVIKMRYMFMGAETFNQPLNDWNVSSATDMDHMFHGATAFNQNISCWNVAQFDSFGPTFFSLESGLKADSLPKWGTSGCTLSSGLLENDFGHALHVYPNPTKGAITIDLGARQASVELSLTDPTGRQVGSTTYTDAEKVTYTVLQPAGVYFMTLTSADQRAVIRLVKE